MTTPSTITRWLTQPFSLSENDYAEALALCEAYPYFVPAKYVEVLQRNRENPFSSEMMESIYLHKGNWLLLHEFLNASENKESLSSEFILPGEDKIEEPLIQPVYTEDYFRHQGLHVSEDIPEAAELKPEEQEKSLMVVMSFSEWLLHFKTKGEKEKEEQEEQKALKTMWQKEKLAAALEEENDEIPETVFEMAVNSITNEEDLVSESLAEIMVKQRKYEKAIDMYHKLSLRNPQKKIYFARKIEALQKEKES